MTDVPVWVPMVTGIGGLALGLLGRFTMTKKERADVSQKNYENAVAATAEHKAAYQAYVAALTAYCRADQPTMDDFLRLSSTGDVYFNQIARMCDAILADRIDASTRDATWLPKIKVAFDRLLPAHYETLRAQADKRGYTDYTGKLRRSDHESIFVVAERFGQSDAWLRPHEDD